MVIEKNKSLVVGVTWKRLLFRVFCMFPCLPRLKSPYLGVAYSCDFLRPRGNKGERLFFLRGTAATGCLCVSSLKCKCVSSVLITAGDLSGRCDKALNSTSLIPAPKNTYRHRRLFTSMTHQTAVTMFFLCGRVILRTFGFCTWCGATCRLIRQRADFMAFARLLLILFLLILAKVLFVNLSRGAATCGGWWEGARGALTFV